MKTHIIAFILICFTIMTQIRILTTPGFFPMHDDTQVGRVVAMGKALRNGQFPVRWVSDLGYGYGYPLFNFYGPLPYYVGGLLYSFGFSGFIATKIMIGIGILSAAYIMYWCASRIFGKMGGLISGVFYVYMPYHSVQLYVRGAIGEYWASIFLPLICLGIYESFKHKNWLSKLLIGVGLAGTILSHTLLGYVTLIILLLYLLGVFLFSIYKSSKLTHFSFTILWGIVIGLGISSFFWMPALFEMHYTSVSGQVSSTADFRDHFVCLSQLWYSQWGFGGSQLGCQDGLSFALGKAFIIISLLGGVILFSKATLSQHKQFLFIAGGIWIISLFLMTSISLPVWEIIPRFEYLQYPWRFLTLMMIPMAFIAGGIVMLSEKKLIKLLLLVIVLALIYWKGNELARPQYIYDRNVSEFETQEELKFRVSKISDEYLPPDFMKPTRVEDIANTTIIENPIFTHKQITEKETFKKYEFRAQNETQITLQMVHFPGWIYIVNGKEQPIILNGGKPVITIPRDFSTLEAKFTNTPIRTIGNLISFVFVVVLIYIYGKKTIS